MRDIRESIIEQKFPQFVQNYMLGVYPDREYPTWIKEALEAVHIELL